MTSLLYALVAVVVVMGLILRALLKEEI